VASISGTITGITVTNPGSGYTSAPTITLTQGGGTGAAAVANFTNGVPLGTSSVHPESLGR